MTESFIKQSLCMCGQNLRKEATLQNTPETDYTRITPQPHHHHMDVCSRIYEEGEYAADESASICRCFGLPPCNHTISILCSLFCYACKV